MPQRRLLTLVIATLAVTFGATALLSSVYHGARDRRVAAHLTRGGALAAQHDLEAAAAEYKAALLIDRDNLDAGRALALTLLALHRYSEADSYIRGLLVREPTDGALNRARGRVAVARGRDQDARVSYQRAVYGEWPADASAERIATRFELIDHLRRVGARDEVLAELLRLRAEMPRHETAVARRVADLLVEQGATTLAAETLAVAAESAPRDVDLLAQLASLQLREHRVADAAATLRRALRLDPARKDIAARREEVDRILTLDPTLPGLRLVTRTRRARTVLQAVMAQTRQCSAAFSEEATALERTIARRLRQPARMHAPAAEEELDLAASLWAHAAACHDTSPEARALTYVLRRVRADGPARP